MFLESLEKRIKLFEVQLEIKINHCVAQNLVADFRFATSDYFIECVGVMIEAKHDLDYARKFVYRSICSGYRAYDLHQAGHAVIPGNIGAQIHPRELFMEDMKELRYMKTMYDIISKERVNQ